LCVAGIANLLSDHGAEQPKRLLTRRTGRTQTIQELGLRAQK